MMDHLQHPTLSAVVQEETGTYCMSFSHWGGGSMEAECVSPTSDITALVLVDGVFLQSWFELHALM